MRRARSAIRKQVPMSNEHLHDEHGAIMVHTEQCKDGGQKCRIAGNSNVGWGDSVPA